MSDQPPKGAQPFQEYSGKVSSQALVFLAGTVFSVVVGYLFKVYVGQQLGPEGLGLYALGQRTVELLLVVADLGLAMSLARHVSLYKSTGQGHRVRGLLIGAVLAVTLTTGLAATLLFFARHAIATHIFDSPELAVILPLFALLLPLGTLNTLLGEYLRGHQEVARRTLVGHFIQLPAKVALTVALFAGGWGLMGYVAGELGSLLLAGALLAYFGWRLTPPADPKTPVPGPRLDGKVWAYARSMVGLSALGFASTKADMVILGILLTPKQVGIYSIALTTAAFVPTLLKALNSIFGPVISDLHARNEHTLLTRLFQTTTKWCLVLTCPLVAVLVVYAADFMALFGPGFRVGGGVLAILALGQLINVGTGSVGNLLVMSGHQKYELWSAGFIAVITLGLDFLLIPRHGLLGAAIAAAVGLAVANILRLLIVHRVLGIWAYNRSLFHVFPALAVSALSVRWLFDHGPQGPLGILLALAVGYAVLILAAIPALDLDDRLFIDSLWRKIRRAP